MTREDHIIFFKFAKIDKRDIEKALDQGYSIGYSVKGLEGRTLMKKLST